jgi:hypothetical protein
MSEANSMSFIERSSFTKSSFQIPTPSENVVLTIIAGAFLILHVAVGIAVQKSLPANPAVTLHEAKSPHYD